MTLNLPADKVWQQANNRSWEDKAKSLNKTGHPINSAFDILSGRQLACRRAGHPARRIRAGLRACASDFAPRFRSASCRTPRPPGCVFSARSAAVLGSRNVSTPNYAGTLPNPARAQTGCARDGCTPLNTPARSSLDRCRYFHWFQGWFRCVLPVARATQKGPEMRLVFRRLPRENLPHQLE